MRVLVLPKNLELGGTQQNSVNTSLALARLGHDVELASEDGPLGERVRNAGITVHRLPPPTARLRRIVAMRRLMRATRPEVVHAYEVRGILEAAVAGHLVGAVPLLGSILSTRVPWFLPETIPLTVGMPALARFTDLWRQGHTELIEPAVTTSEPTPGHVPGLERLGDGDNLVVLVSRLVEPFKREGILRVIAAVHDLAPRGYRLLIVGDGPARALYERAAAATNRASPTEVVAFSGAMEEPAPAYAASNIVVGSGMSVIRAAMSGTPSVVVGREGYSAVVGLETLPELMSRGFYGVGEGLSAPDPLARQIVAAREQAEDDEIDAVASQLTERYGITGVAKRYEAALFRAISAETPDLGSLGRCLARVIHYRYHRLRFRRAARRESLAAENLDNFVYGRLRNLALPPAHWGTGRNR